MRRGDGSVKSRRTFDGHPKYAWLCTAVERRIREELATLHVEVNEDKTRRVDLVDGDRFGFLGFDFRRVRSRRGRWMPLRVPQTKKRSALFRTLQDVFRRSASQPTAPLIAKVNRTVRGWVAYFAVGHSGRCFSYVRDWIEKAVRRHLQKARGRQGFGWKRWSRTWLYQTLGLFDDYRVRYRRARPKAALA